MEKRESKVSFSKAGNGVGSKVTLPMPWLKKMNISQVERDIELFFNEESQEITIRKRK